LLLSGFSQSAFAVLDWPQEVTAEEGKIVVYQPQPEKLEGNILTGRAAMMLDFEDKTDSIFGTFWFRATIETDKDSNTALIRDLKVTDVRWPESKDAGEQRFTAIVEAAIPETGFEISLDRLSSSLATAQLEQKSLADLKNDPPAIIFRESIAVLLLYDGEPRYTKIENSSYERVMNTPFVVVRDKKARYYLSSGQLWYEATDAMGPWKPTTSPPKDLAAMMPEPEGDSPPPTTPPEVVVATEPTELIATDGEPNWESLTGGELLYVSNTESPWVRDLSTGNMYVLLSGRWYRSKSTEGPWTFVKSDELPASFANIPPASDIGGLRTSVAGTPEADDAMLDAQIPQTAAIKRSEASLTVEYDGKPKFENISGTKVSYAVNTPSQVLEIDKKYYAADNGVWFTAASATGPWEVADKVPEDEIAKIPPSSPVYNTTNVHIYESTPEVVYVGYTPGYMWSYPYYGVPVYGTGWRYPPYLGPVYYPRPPTWGFNVGYNPWTGWNFGMSWSNGFFSVGVSFGGGYGGYRPGCCGSGWYGGGGYRGPTVINTGDINIGNNVNVGNRTNISNKLDKNPNFNQNNISKSNLYNRPENRARNADRATVDRDMKQAREASGRANNVYADDKGNVARKADDKWQTRDNGAWKDNPELNDKAASARDNVTPEQRDKAASARDNVTPEQKNAATQAAQSRDQQTRSSSRSSGDNRQRDLDRASNARNSGAARERSRPTSTRSAPKGGNRGGGRRR